MKRKLYILPAMILLLLPLAAAAQQLKLGSSPATISKAAVLELESTKQGLLLTRITDTTLAPLTTAPDGTLLFFNGDNSLRIRSGNAWRKTLTAIDTNNIASFSQKVRSLFSGTGPITYNSATGNFSLTNGTGSFWALGGNNVSATQTIGTSGNYDLPFITNNTERMRISAAGNVGIANTNPQAKLDVGGTFKLGAAGTVLSSVIKGQATFSGSGITYSQSFTKLVTVNGAMPHASVIVNPAGSLPQGVGIAYAYVNAANSVTINITNTGAGLLGIQSFTNVTFDITVINQ